MTFERHDTKIGRYHVRYILGQGGMASVYLAQAVGTTGFERWVALKVIHNQYSRDRRFVTMFLDEARVLSRLYHPAVCAVFDSGEVEGTHFIAMEYLHGEPFNKVIQKNIPFDLATRIICDAARGLHAAHELKDERGELLGLVHRDVSPHNIIVLYDGFAKVVDFGIARARDRLTDTTTGGHFKGKLAYMAPEQIEASQSDRRSDIYALGVVLWEATVGWRLFKRGTAAATMKAALYDEVPQPSKLKSGYPMPLERVVMKALERDASKRWETMQIFADALEECLLEEASISSSSQVAAWMCGAFEERRKVREEILRTPYREGSSVPDGQSFPIDIDGEGGKSRSQGELSQTDFSGVVSSKRKRRTQLYFMALAAVLVVMVGAVVGFAFFEATSLEGERTIHAASGVDGGFAVDASLVSSASMGKQDGGQGPRNAASDGQAADLAATKSTDSGVRSAQDSRVKRPRAKLGYLNVVAVPVARVWLGSRLLGTTPLRKTRLPAGVHRLKLRAVRGDGAKRVSVRVRPNKVSYLSVDLGQ